MTATVQHQWRHLAKHNIRVRPMNLNGLTDHLCFLHLIPLSSPRLASRLVGAICTDLTINLPWLAQVALT